MPRPSNHSVPVPTSPAPPWSPISNSEDCWNDTIVLWTGEFGRLPISQGTDGRDHNRHGFSLWLAGGGFKQGYVHGATDDFGYQSVDGAVTVHDLQATLLHALGLDHRKLTYPHEGRAIA